MINKFFQDLKYRIAVSNDVDSTINGRESYFYFGYDSNTKEVIFAEIT